MIAQSDFDSLLEKGDKHYNDGRYREAIECYDRALENNPNDVETLRRKATTFLALDDDDAALKFYEQIIAVKPHESWAWVEKGDLFVWQERYVEAIACYDKGVHFDPKNKEIWQKEGSVFRELERFDEALRAYDQAVQIDPTDSRTWSGKGDVLFDLKRYSAAFDCYKKAETTVGEFSFQASDWAYRGDLLQELDDAANAIFCYDRALARDQKYFWAWRGKGLTLGSQNHPEEALDCFEKAIAIAAEKTESALAWTDKGNVFLDQGKYAEATTCYDKALEIEPHNFAALFNRGLSCQNQDKIDEAVDLYDKAIEIDPEASFVWEAKAECLEQVSRWEEAAKCYDEVIKLKPDSLWAFNNKGWDLLQLKMFKDALELFDKAIAIDPKESQPWINKAACLQKLDQIDEAVQCLESARKVVESQYEVLQELGYIFSQYKHDYEKALEFDRQTLEICGDDTDLASLAKANIAEDLVNLGRYNEGRTYALQVDRDSNDGLLQCVTRYLTMVSYALEGDTKNSDRQFRNFIQHLWSPTEDQKYIVKESDWDYRAVINAIATSNASLDTKFLLLTLIDLQAGKIPVSNLSFFSESPI